ncbi:DoxX family protein [Spirillospora sp. NBC_01491]|uniref:DoxX family protein n=1 Tax=Spirillospora sp. NBC_01491 TaxID=2976007 RepID=UPI002E366259|nr:DoxX family protein [Spirillospora sp. NBC_01491]
MNLLLWILQAALAALFGAAGVMTSTQPKDKLEPKLPWTVDFSTHAVRFIGLAELVGALGLILPAATGLVPILTPLAATGLALLMALAALTHLRRKESTAIALNAVLLIAAAVIAWGRFGPHTL